MLKINRICIHLSLYNITYFKQECVWKEKNIFYLPTCIQSQFVRLILSPWLTWKSISLISVEVRLFSVTGRWWVLMSVPFFLKHETLCLWQSTGHSYLGIMYMNRYNWAWEKCKNSVFFTTKNTVHLFWELISRCSP